MTFSKLLMAAAAAGPLLLICAPAHAQVSSSPPATPPTAPSGGQSGGNPDDKQASPAATTSATPTPTPTPGANGTTVGEVIVTAEKRSQSVNKVGLTIQAISGDQLAQKGISTVADLTRAVPALSVENSTYNTPVYNLRGVGFYDNSLAAYPAVSVYVDEVPLPFPVMTGQAGMDVAQVEVLKGPQGTLFGENSTGGAINFIAAKPTRTAQEGLDVSYSRFNLFQGDAFISGPITDTLRFRLSLKGEDGGAWQKSYTRDDTLGNSDVFAGRLIVDWDATDRLKFELNINGSIDKSDPQAGQYFALHPQLPVVPAGLTNAAFAPQNDRAADWDPNRRPSGDDRQYQDALHATYALTNDLTLTSITSYVHFQRNQVNDPDGLAAESLEFNFNGGVQSFNQEVRISNANANRFRWIVGGNFENNSSKEFAQQFDGVSTVNATLAFPANSNNTFLNTQTKSYAAFADTDFDVTSKLTIKGGIRYTATDRKAQTCTLDPGNDNQYVSDFFAGVASEVLGRTVAPPASGGCITLDQTTFLPELFTGKLDQNNISWKAGADYKLYSNVLLYFNAAKGYKAGGFLFTNASNTDQYNPVAQESVLDYEGGFKATLFDHSVQINGAGFHYDYTNKQTRSELIDPVFGVLNALVNVPKSELTGGEAEITYSPIRDLHINFAGTYVASKIDQFTGVGFDGGVENFAGAPLPFIPKWSLNGGADYEHPITADFKGFAGFDASYTGHSFSVVGTDEDTKLNAYALLNLRAGIATTDGKYRLTLFGNNVTDRYYYTNAPLIYDTQVRYTGRPATYGVTLSARW